MMLIIYRSDVVLAVFFAVLFGALVISSYLTLYLRYYWISFVIICIGVFLPWRLRITRQALARKKERLLPLSFWSVTLVPQIWLSGLTNCIPRTYYAMGFTWTLRKLEALSQFRNVITSNEKRWYGYYSLPVLLMNSHEAPENHTKVKFISLPINLQVREVLRGPSDHKSFLCRRKCLRRDCWFYFMDDFVHAFG